MDYNELVTTVIATTARPELTALIQLKVREAILSMHRQYDFTRDLTVATDVAGTYNSTNNSFTISRSAVPFLRVLKLLEAADRNNPSFSRQIKEGDLEALYSHERIVETLDRYFRIGQEFIIRTTNKADENIYNITYFKNPEITPSSVQTTWLMQDYPQVIYNKVILDVFATTDRQNQVKYYSSLYALNLDELLATEITEVN